MSEHKATIKWTQSQGDFLKGTYSREHTWTFDGGVTVPGFVFTGSRARSVFESCECRSRRSFRCFALQLPHADVLVCGLAEGF